MQNDLKDYSWRDPRDFEGAPPEWPAGSGGGGDSSVTHSHLCHIQCSVLPIPISVIDQVYRDCHKMCMAWGVWQQLVSCGQGHFTSIACGLHSPES